VPRPARLSTMGAFTRADNCSVAPSGRPGNPLNPPGGGWVIFGGRLTKRSFEQGFSLMASIGRGDPCHDGKDEGGSAWCSVPRLAACARH
jgi:hypothetical protein